MPSPLRGVIGDKTAKVLDKGLGLQTCGDLLRHYPRRYVERAVLTPLTELVPDEYTTVMAEIVTAKTRPMRQRRGTLLEVVVTDGRGTLTLTFFNQSWRKDKLLPGYRGLFSGKVGMFNGRAQLTHPECQLLHEDDAADETLLSRSEEHTSELQSRQYLVCRLLL